MPVSTNNHNRHASCQINRSTSQIRSAPDRLLEQNVYNEPIPIRHRFMYVKNGNLARFLYEDV